MCLALTEVVSQAVPGLEDEKETICIPSLVPLGSRLPNRLLAPHHFLLGLGV